MRSFLKLVILFCLTATSCGTTDISKRVSGKIQASIVDTPKKNVKPTTEPINMDTLIIDKEVAVVTYAPSIMQIKKRKKEIGIEDFMTGADDYIYYLNTSVEYLQKQDLKVVDSKDKKFLKFVSSSNTQVIKLDTLPELWGIFFFDGKSEPFLADMTIIEDEYKKYYK